MKTKFTIKLNRIDDLNSFIKEIVTFESDIDAIRGRYVIDAKSLMGLLSLDLSLPLDIEINAANEEELTSFNEFMQKYLD